MYAGFLKGRTALLLSILLAFMLAFQGCGGGSGGGVQDNIPDTNDDTDGGGGDGDETVYSGGVFITAETLKGWVDAGKVNTISTDRVVILDISNSSDYNAGHIPGAILVDIAELYQTRSDGIIYSINEVPDGPTMDVLIDKWGIDEFTTVVFTSAASTQTSASGYLNVTRAYYTFRYWGFTKDKLKVLNGLNAAYSHKYGGLTTDVPTIEPHGNFGVRLFESLWTCRRASLKEMIDFADGKIPNSLAIDARGGDGPGGTAYSYDGDYKATSGVFNPPGDYVAFEGHIKGAVALNWSTLFKAVDANGDGTDDYRQYLPETELTSIFTGIGLDSSKTAYVYCRSGVIASSVFAVLEAMGRNAINYDGSWSEWSQLAGKENGGYLENDSPWRTDIPSRTENPTFNKDAGAVIENPGAGGEVDSYDRGNRIEDADIAYNGNKPN